jgi:hypothetical protein
MEVAAQTMQGEGSPLFREHLPLWSFVNRATSLHDGVIAAVHAANPHAAFTLLRAQVELMVLLRYLDRHPEYLDDLERPGGRRRQFRELFAEAAEELRGIRNVYATLSEMAHFGSTALWHPFSVGDTDETARRLSYGTAPHWRHADEPRVVLGMLAEAEDGLLVMLDRYLRHHVLPKVEEHVAGERARTELRSAMIRAGIVGEDDLVIGPVAASAVQAGLLRWCEEHEAVEPESDVTPERIDAWAVRLPPPGDEGEAPP